MSDNERDKPSIEKIAPTLLRSVGVSLVRNSNKVKFVFRDKEIIDDLKQLGFSLDILRVNGGEMPLPILAEHVDNHASLEAYWGARAEKVRYQLMLAQDSFQYWFESKYSRCFGELQDMGVPKPIQKEVEARISRKYKTVLLEKKKKVRKLERDYRLLHNACVMSVSTKGRMMQTLRNIIQGGNVKMGIVDVEVQLPSVNRLTPTFDS